MSYKNYIHDLESILDLYKEACLWLDELGFKYSNTRYSIYESVFRVFDSASKGNDEKDVLSPDYHIKFKNAYLEANELIRVYTQLKNIGIEQYSDQIRKIMKGVEFRKDFSKDSARDFLFELTIAARFIKCGYSTTLNGICDTVTNLGKKGTLFVECKRVKSASQIENNIKKANKQIKTRVKNSTLLSKKGLIAINITNLLSDQVGIVPTNYLEGQMLHQQEMKRVLDANKERLRKELSNGCLGILVESSKVYFVDDNVNKPSIMYSRHSTLIPSSDKASILEYINWLAPQICNQDIK